MNINRNLKKIKQCYLHYDAQKIHHSNQVLHSFSMILQNQQALLQKNYNMILLLAHIFHMMVQINTMDRRNRPSFKLCRVCTVSILPSALSFLVTEWPCTSNATTSVITETTESNFYKNNEINFFVTGCLIKYSLDQNVGTTYWILRPNVQ